MSARLHLLIWLIVLVRMCAVSLPESRVSVFNGLNTQTYAPYVANVDNAARNKGETKIAARQAASDLGTERPAAADAAEKAVALVRDKARAEAMREAQRNTIAPNAADKIAERIVLS